MKNEIEESFSKDVLWILSELKQEELANVYSTNKFKFFFTEKSSDDMPEIRSQKRVIQMLIDVEAIDASPIYHAIPAISNAFSSFGSTPIGYYIQTKQTKFDELLSDSKKTVRDFTKIKEKEDSVKNKSVYNVSLSPQRKVLLNETYILSSPRFHSENEQFIEYILQNANKTLKKEDFEKDGNIKLKKKFHSILNDLGFKNEIRKIFFNASKTSIHFQNNISKEDFIKLEIDDNKLQEQLSDLERNKQK